MCISFCRDVCFLLGNYAGVAGLDHIVGIYLIFYDTDKLSNSCTILHYALELYKSTASSAVCGYGQYLKF